MMFYATIILVIVGQLTSADQQKELSSASADFSQRLYQKVALGTSSVIYSPYSIHSALTMTSLGAGGDTTTEMSNTLGVTSLGDAVHQTYNELIEQINSVTDLKLNTGNAILVNPRYEIVPKFMQETADYYYAIADNIDMSANGGPEKPINDYIAYKTENMIVNLLAPGTIQEDTAMLLVNTIFFKGSWKQAFQKERTRYQDFYLLGGNKKQIEMMHDERVVNITRDYANGVDVAELPYKGGRFSMYVALPQQNGGITSLDKLLSKPNTVNELFTGLSEVKVELAIPKFKTESTLTLKPALQSLGMIKAFSRENANFTGISQAGTVYIDQVLHKAVIEVEETGTVAAAVTAVHGRMKASAVVEERLETFIADHPFVYFLRDKLNGQILFQGKFSG